MAKKANDIELKEKKPDLLSAFIDKVVEETDIERMEDMHKNVVVQSSIPSYNRASAIGGISTGCTYSLCGESAGGKSTFGILACNVFADAGYPSLYIDAETTADADWFKDLGMNLHNTQRLVPDSLEHCTSQVDKFISKYIEFKLKEPNWAAVIVLDSYNKVRPKDEMENTIVEGKQYPIHALLMTQWFNKLTPVLYKNDIAFMVVRHDRANMKKKNAWEKDYQVSGAFSMMYENSMMVRFNVSSKEEEEQNGKKVTIGYWHNFKVEKNKDGIRDEAGRFFISNGKGDIPKGYNEYMTAIEEGIYQGVICNEKNRFVISGISDERYTQKDLYKCISTYKKLYQDLLKLLNTYWERRNDEKSKKV